MKEQRVKLYIDSTELDKVVEKFEELTNRMVTIRSNNIVSLTRMELNYIKAAIEYMHRNNATGFNGFSMTDCLSYTTNSLEIINNALKNKR